MRVRMSICAAVAAAGVLAVGGCDADEPQESAADRGSLSQAEYDAAVEAARDQIGPGDVVDRATATVHEGRVGASNTGHPCPAGQRLEVALVGDFPHIVTTGTPGSSDTTVREVDLTVDPATGETCLIGVRTAAGTPSPDQVELDLG